MENIKSELLLNIEGLSGRIETLIKCFDDSDILSTEMVLSEGRKTMEMIGRLAMYVRSIIPLSFSDDHSTKSILNDYMCEVTGAAKAINTNINEFFGYAKRKIKFSDKIGEDEELKYIFTNDYNMLKKGLIGQNIQAMTILRRGIYEDVRLARCLFGRDWASNNVKNNETDNWTT